ncbi:MAG: DUF6033 family protein [Lachnospiraceae bacterium]|nr:DUF6033 family protein [Lachnospiraceae bacterium]
MSRIDGFNAYQDNFFKTALKDMPVPKKHEKDDKGIKAENEAASLEISANKTEKEDKTGGVQLSQAAQDLLDELKSKYSNMDFMVANYSSDEEASEILSRGTKEFSVLIEPELLEEMAADENVKNKYIGIIEDSTQKIADIKEELNSNIEDGTEVKSIGISVSSDGTVKYFAEMKKAGEAQAERLEKSKEKKAEKEALEERREAIKDKYAPDKPEDKYAHTGDKTARVEGSSIEELLEKIKGLDWDEIRAIPPKEAGSKIDFSA